MLLAQARDSVRVTVTVVGAGNRAIAGSEVTLFRGEGQAVVAHGVTDAAGVGRLKVLPAAQPVLLAARKIGFRVVRQTIKGLVRDTTIRFTLEPQVRTLDAMRSEAEMDRRHYIIGSDEIAHTNRGLFDALIVLQKLRPQMLGDGMRTCDPTDKIWINGRRIMFGAIAVPRYNMLDTILASIKGEHIGEMRYISCWDTPPDGLQRDALYITLKPGVDWDWKHGSFVADSALAGRPR